MRHKRFVALALLICLIIPAGLVTAQGPVDVLNAITAEQVMAHIQALSVDIGARKMGSPQEEQAAEYIQGQFESWGYEVEIQEFDATAGEADRGAIISHNVIATHPGDDQVIVVGAHMDSVTAGTGAGDNASGVAVVLAAAEVLANVDTEHTILFVTFGAEETGDPMGSEYFVESLGDDIDNVIAMINVDSVGVGTNMNVYAGAKILSGDEDEDHIPDMEGGPTWVRDLALNLADQLGLPFGTTPDDTWGGYTGSWSDHYAFVEADVPIAYFEAWQWEPSESTVWGQETANGDVMHTAGDVYENVVPEKVEMAAELVTATTLAIANGEADVSG